MALRNRSNRSESFVATPSDVGLGREIARNIYSTTAAAGSQMTTLQQRVGRENAQDAELLLDLSIKALTKMLAANLEIGLQYSLTVVYHEDPKLRALFTNMFTDILREGIDIDSLSGDTPDHWKTRLIDMLVHPDLKLLLAINEVCQVQDIDELGAVLTDIFESRNSIKVLLERIITVELERTDSAAELFRRNCLATRLLSYFAKIHGDTYLKSTLGPALRKLMSLPPGTLTFELNPNKMSEMADRDRNLKNVERLCSLVIEAIVRSVHSMPAAFRSICNMIYRVVTTRFPDAGYTAVGGFIFLRFLCPAIVAPDSHGICAQIENPEIRRGLLLCTKITHNLANDVPFGNKETYMVPLNRFINENRPRILNFLSEIAELPDETDSVFEGRARSIASSTGGGRPSTEYGAPSEPDTDASSQIATGVDAKQFLVVQRFIFDHMDRLEAYLTRESMVRVQGPLMKPADRKKGSDKKSSLAASANPSATDANVSQSKTNVAETTGVATSTENLFTQVSYVMRQLGPPPPVVAENAPSKMMAEAEINSENVFYDILRRDAHRPTDAIAKKAIIYIGGVSREKRPVIYIIVRRLQMQYLDMDLVLLHIMRTLEPFANKSYEVFFDLTQFGPANEVPLQWLTQLRRIIPQGILHNA
ncbi:Ras GTPase activating protein ira2, partial [Linderina macrospora]